MLVVDDETNPIDSIDKSETDDQVAKMERHKDPNRFHGSAIHTAQKSSQERHKSISGKKRHRSDSVPGSRVSKFARATANNKATRTAILLEIKNHGLKRALAREQALVKDLRKDLAGASPQAKQNVLAAVTENFSFDRDGYKFVVDLLLTSEGLTHSKVVEKVGKILKRRMGEEKQESNELRSLQCCSSSFGNLESIQYLNLHLSNTVSLPPSIGRLQNLKEIDLAWTEDLSELPEEFGNLTSLTKLHLYSSNIASLPASIGRLQSLKEIDLSFTHKLTKLPEAFGDITSLTKLNLCNSNIVSLPASIGRLQSLEEINLSSTHKLTKLPEAFGDITSLPKLNLSYSNIASLPASIGRLQNLEEIDLSSTHKLTKLPEAFGNLTSLTKLNLYYSNIRSLPASIGRLQNLEEIDLSSIPKLTKLPETFGNLTSLTKLKLHRSKIRSLPASIGRLQSLEEIDLRKTVQLSGLPKEICNLKNLVTVIMHLSYAEGKAGNPPYKYTVACNRLRIRSGMGTTSKESSVQFPQELWPRLLIRGTKLFERSHHYAPDAIYHALEIGRDSFIGLIISRQKQDPTLEQE
jgi:Leucine-rich repeat (LRR) protein